MCVRFIQVQFDDGDLHDAVPIFDILSERAYAKSQRRRIQEGVRRGGKPTHEITSHPLLCKKDSKIYHREWRDAQGEAKEVFGTFLKCRRDDENELVFTIRFEKASVERLKVAGLLSTREFPLEMEVSEEDAWAGHASYLEHCSDLTPDKINRSIPFHRRYIVPKQRYLTTTTTSTTTTVNNGNAESSQLSHELPTLILHVRGFKLEFTAEPSGIRGAGLGLWMTCTPLCFKARERRQLRLECGEVIDLGVYAPLRPSDIKKEHLFLLKSFIHHWECEEWSFDSTAVATTDTIFDITDDSSGQLHSVARTNIIVYTNETNGKREEPTIWASNDPEGAVHYFLGHPDESRGPLLLPANGKAVELKIDYGPKYEKVRVRKGYSRLLGDELISLIKATRSDDIDMIRELNEATVTEVKESLDFIESTCAAWKDLGMQKEIDRVVRAITATLLLHHRWMVLLQKQMAASSPLRPTTRATMAISTTAMTTTTAAAAERATKKEEDVVVGDNVVDNVDSDVMASMTGRFQMVQDKLCDCVRDPADLKYTLLSNDLFKSVAALVRDAHPVDQVSRLSTMSSSSSSSLSLLQPTTVTTTTTTTKTTATSTTTSSTTTNLNL